MTKERRLAIEMWINIRDMLVASDYLTHMDIIKYKQKFCEDHNLKWKWNCWFCHYIQACFKCPLKSCKLGHPYSVVTEGRFGKGIRVEACNAIIKALEEQ